MRGLAAKDTFLPAATKLTRDPATRCRRPAGTYNLKNVSGGATFGWGVAPMPAGPAGRVSVVNSIIAAGNADSPRKDAALKVLARIGSARGASCVGAEGAALPAVTAAQQGYFDCWKGKGVDTGRTPVAAGLAQAQDTGNAALR